MKRKLEFWVETGFDPGAALHIAQEALEDEDFKVEHSRNSHWDGTEEWTKGHLNDAGPPFIPMTDL